MSLPTHRHAAPSTQDRAIARKASEQLVSHARFDQAPALLFPKEQQSVELPTAAIGPLRDVLEAIAAGQTVAVIPDQSELTTVEAASVLNVSRPFVIKLLDDGVIPHRKVGAHRRIRMEDVMAYKERDDREREAILDQLAREAQEQGMGYRRS